jgi:hypothetical protein
MASMTGIDFVGNNYMILPHRSSLRVSTEKFNDAVSAAYVI